MKCINCGAEITNDVCQYCGTDYTDKHSVSGNIQEKSLQGTLVIAGEEIPVYLCNVDVEFDEIEITTLESILPQRIRKERRRTFVFKELYSLP